MPITIVTGGTGSGKSSYLYDTMLKNLAGNKASNAVLIVPEQFSYTAEKTLSKRLGGLGINNVEVATFSKLLNSIVPQKRSLLESGKTMLVQKAAKSVSNTNVFRLSASHTGFISSLSDLFSEFSRYGILPGDFEDLPQDNPHTAKKLESLNEIYKIYTDSLPDEFGDKDDAYTIFADIVENSDVFENTYFYIDDYNDFMPMHYTAISALAKKSLGVFVTLCYDENSSGTLFLPVEKTKKKLISLAEKSSVPYSLVNLTGKCDYINAADIRFLIENWEEKPKYIKKSENISIFNSLDIFSEVEHTASQIISLVRDMGYRFRDIGILCGDMEQYLHIMTSVFADFDIPFFTDEKLSVSMHPVAKTVLSLFDIIRDNWSYSAVFDYLRTGYIYFETEDGITAISQEDIDLLENYVLLHGIKGKKAWFSEWTKTDETVFDSVIETRKKEDTDLEKLNGLRTKIITPFVTFLENKSRTAAGIAEGVYNFMCDINLFDGILKECEIFDNDGKRNESEQFKQVWNFVIETLDQLVAVSGGGAISREDFADRFSCGISECTISTIPSGLDRVSLGTVSRNSPSRVKALFVMGALDGQFPKISAEGNILSDFDRACLSSVLNEREKELSPDSTGRVLLENFKFYRAFTAATDKLFISFPSLDSEGNPTNQAHFISELSEMFDIEIRENIISKPTADELLASAKHGFYYMLLNLSEFYKKKPEKIWQTVRDWYAENPEYSEKLNIVKSAAEYKKNQPALSRRKAEMLYGKNKKYSITALEKFEKCPFSYYLERGLCLTEQKEYKIEKSHIGSLLHMAIYEFCHMVEDGANSILEIHSKWKNLSEGDAKTLIQAVMDKISEQVLKNADDDEKNRIAYLLSRCRQTLEASINTIRKSLASGEYVAVCYEKDFETVIDWKGDSITLIGVIDRIDIMESIAENKLNIRIVDYKSGNKTFSVEAICDKVDMQLVLYALAAEDLAKKGGLNSQNTLTPSVNAILYSKLADAENTEISSSQIDEFKSDSGKSGKMDGLFILDEVSGGENTSLSKETLYSMDPEIEENLKSEFLNISFKKDGSVTKRSKVATRHNFDILAKYIKKSAVDADKAIKSGNIDIKPYKSGKGTPCDYCGFKEICLFDEKPDGYRTQTKVEDIYAFMEKEVD